MMGEQFFCADPLCPGRSWKASDHPHYAPCGTGRGSDPMAELRGEVHKLQLQIGSAFRLAEEMLRKRDARIDALEATIERTAQTLQAAACHLYLMDPDGETTATVISRIGELGGVHRIGSLECDPRSASECTTKTREGSSTPCDE